MEELQLTCPLTRTDEKCSQSAYSSPWSYKEHSRGFQMNTWFPIVINSTKGTADRKLQIKLQTDTVIMFWGLKKSGKTEQFPTYTPHVISFPHQPDGYPVLCSGIEGSTRTEKTCGQIPAWPWWRQLKLLKPLKYPSFIENPT